MYRIHTTTTALVCVQRLVRQVSGDYRYRCESEWQDLSEMTSAPPLSAILRHTRPVFKESLKAVSPTLQSELSNGFKIATQAKKGDTCTVGVWIDAGSRWENEENNGVAHYLEHLNFKVFFISTSGCAECCRKRWVAFYAYRVLARGPDGTLSMAWRRWAQP